jgi:urocanate hydratase
MYIGPQGIVHGTTITILNAVRKIAKLGEGLEGKLFLSSGLGGMSGAQSKAAKIAGCVSVVAEVNDKVATKRASQGWVDILISDLDLLCKQVKDAKRKKMVVSFGFIGNIVDVWKKFLAEKIFIDLGSDQTSLHNPWAGGYYPAGLSFEQSNIMMVEDPNGFRNEVQRSLREQADVISKHAEQGTYFFDYGNAFLLEASRAGADVMADNGIDFRYPSYVQDIMGPLCFDYGFGPFRWVCTTGKPEDLEFTDQMAKKALEEILKQAEPEIHSQIQDNIQWIAQAASNNLVVGSQARILYADAAGRMKIATAFNKAVADGKIGPVVLGRDHHDVSGTDSPYRETSNIYDGSKFTADMAIHNVIGDSFRGATWVSIHNGGGVGWGEVINGGFGLVLDGSREAFDRIHSMLHFDVYNGVARRSWARNPNALSTLKHELDANSQFRVTLPNEVADDILDRYVH